MAKADDRSAGSPGYYIAHIAQYDREFKRWEGRADKILKRYKMETVRQNQDSRFNVLWSNVQTLKAATFSRLPKPDVSRRFKDSDPVGRVASLLIERALEFEVDHYNDFHDTLKHSVYDRFLGGRGVAWVRYEPVFVSGVNEEAEAQITEDVESETDASEQLDFECAPTDYVHWRDFGHSVARTWEEVTCVWRKVYLTRSAAIERFGAKDGGKLPLDASPRDKEGRTDPDSVGNRALVYEIWCKETGSAYWLSKSSGKFIDEKSDPLGLEEFFPCPRPLYSTVTNDSLVPIPDFVLYQDQANQLDLLSDRIDGLIKALQIRGVYNAAEPILARLFSEGSNTEMLPVTNWMAFAEKQGLKGAIDLVDIAPIAGALSQAYMAFKSIKDQIYELTGISDIIRGETMASETATAQGIKDKYATLRLQQYQDEVSRYATDLLRLKAQIICNHFDGETIAKMSGATALSQQDQQLIPAALEMIKDNPTRNFRINISADSLIYMDEQAEKQDRMEFLSATSGFIEKLVQAGQTTPQVLGLGVEMLKFGVTGFRVGKTLEGVIDQVGDQIKQQAAQPAQQKPNPDQIKAQAATQAAQMHAQQADALHQREMAQKGQESQISAQLEAQRMQMSAQQAAAEQRQEMQLETMRQQHQAAMAQMQQSAEAQTKLLIAQLDRTTKIEVAEIAAQTTLNAQQIAAAQAGVTGE